MSCGGIVEDGVFDSRVSVEFMGFICDTSVIHIKYFSDVSNEASMWRVFVFFIELKFENKGDSRLF